MTLLDDLRADQHMERQTTSDKQLEAFLAEVNPEVARLDLIPHTDVEVRHLAHATLTTDWEIL